MRHKVKHVIVDATTDQQLSELYDDLTEAEREAAWRDHEYELYREDKWEREHDQAYVDDIAND